MSGEPGCRESDVLLAVTTLSFDISGLELYLPLLVGARVVLASREVASDARQLIELMDSSGMQRLVPDYTVYQPAIVLREDEGSTQLVS